MLSIHHSDNPGILYRALARQLIISPGCCVIRYSKVRQWRLLNIVMALLTISPGYSERMEAAEEGLVSALT